MAMQFTSGPWEVRNQFIGPRLSPDSSIQVRVARVNDDYEDPEAAANARLIAAAPEMYEALLYIVTTQDLTTQAHEAATKALDAAVGTQVSA